jgi:hypothetical protein
MKTIYGKDERSGLVPEVFSAGAKRFLALVAAMLMRTESSWTSGPRQRSQKPRQKGFVNVPLNNARNFPH